ncbi:hypothetical protein COB47_1737 [Caldicellulosiruptor obsidiansis OB47]|uniref:Dienelactone hydrolase domain-containing protein n=2 Tax=Caldicellulosiruptor TaxID=44000 RepID=D9TFP6_CALOO|nr:hypothetical protein COB47_1737 [Caldicellulosiruptor obsidiansis OB47]
MISEGIMMSEIFEKYFGKHNSFSESTKWGEVVSNQKTFEEQRKIVDKLVSLLYLNLSLIFREDKKFEIDHGEFKEEIIAGNLNGIHSEAVLLKPRDLNPPYPVVVVLHDHGGFYYYGKERIYRQDNTQTFVNEYQKKFYSSLPWALEFVKNGFAVFSPDAFYFGKRRLSAELIELLTDDNSINELLNYQEGLDEYIRIFNKISSQLEPIMFKNINLYGTNWPSILLNEDLAWLNYLLQREDVEKKRIGCMGFSLGGFRTLFLSSLRNEIKCSIIIAFMSEFRKMLGKTARHTFMVHIPGFTRVLDLPDVAALIAPRKLFIMQCEYDSLFPKDAMQSAVERIKSYFVNFDCGNQFEYKFYPNGHEFNLNMQKDALEYITKNL